jgi:hypothetical protein
MTGMLDFSQMFTHSLNDTFIVSLSLEMYVSKILGCISFLCNYRNTLDTVHVLIFSLML